jgi:hypothetical protein
VNSEEPAIKFLGVFLDPKLNFKHHVAKIVSKISRSLYVIQMAKNLLSVKALKSLYYALVHSHLIYGIQVWCSAPASVISPLEKVQKKALRIINNAPYNSHTEPLFKNCEILPLMYLIKYFKLLFMYDFSNNLLPVSFHNIWLTNAQKRNIDALEPPRALRDDHLYHVPFIRLEHYFKFPLADYPRTWNEFNNKVVAQNRETFKKLLKDELLSNLSANVNCNRLLCPECHLRVAVTNEL